MLFIEGIFTIFLVYVTNVGQNLRGQKKNKKFLRKNILKIIQKKLRKNGKNKGKILIEE